MRTLIVCLLFLTISAAAATAGTVPPGGQVNLGHGFTITNNSNQDVTYDMDGYFDPVTGDHIWILEVDVPANAQGQVIVNDQNDTYNGPPGFQNDTAVDLRDPGNNASYTGSGVAHGNGHVSNKVNGTPVGDPN
jgi:hypothetical protein